MAEKFKSLADTLGLTPLENEPEEIDWNEPKTAKDFALLVLNSPQYRNSIRSRILMNELPPAVECWLLNTAYGKPLERMEVLEKQTVTVETIAQMREKVNLLNTMLQYAESRPVHPPKPDTSLDIPDDDDDFVPGVH